MIEMDTVRASVSFVPEFATWFLQETGDAAVLMDKYMDLRRVIRETWGDKGNIPYPDETLSRLQFDAGGDYEHPTFTNYTSLLVDIMVERNGSNSRLVINSLTDGFSLTITLKYIGDDKFLHLEGKTDNSFQGFDWKI